jgi:hypothetical protein
MPEMPASSLQTAAPTANSKPTDHFLRQGLSQK